MVRTSLSGSIFCVAFLSVLAVVSSSSGASVPFEEDFENISAGDYPDENGWHPHTIWGPIEAHVSEERAHSGQMSFRFTATGDDNIRGDYVELDNVPDHVTAEVAVYIESNGDRTAGAGIFLGEGGEPGSGLERGLGVGFEMYREMYYVAYPDTGEMIYLGPWEPGRWYFLRLDIDFAENNASVWLDGEMIRDGLPTLQEPPTQLFLTGQARTGYSFYFDDIKVYESCGEADLTITDVEIPGGNPTEGELTPINVTLQNIGGEIFHADEVMDSHGYAYNGLVQLELWDNEWPYSPYCRSASTDNDIKRHVKIPDLLPGESCTVMLSNIKFRVATTPTHLVTIVKPINGDVDLHDNHMEMPIYIWPDFISEAIDCARLWLMYLSPHYAPITASIDLGEIHYTYEITEGTLKTFENGVYLINDVDKVHNAVASEDWAGAGTNLAKMSASIAHALLKDPVSTAINVAITVYDGVWACSELLLWGMDTYEKWRVLFYNFTSELANSYGVEVAGMFTGSPVNLLAIDTHGYRAGVTQNGIVEEIEKSAVSIGDTSQLVMFNKTEFSTVITGTGIGSYNLNVLYPYQGGVLVATFEELPVVPGMSYVCAYNWHVLSDGGDGITLSVDYEGDGVMDYSSTVGLWTSIDELPVLESRRLRVDIEPQTLDCRSEGKWITCHVRLPEGFDPLQVDGGSVLLADCIAAEQWIAEKNNLLFKFDRQAVCGICPAEGARTMRLSGSLVNGTQFVGKGTVTILR
jgi:hypothetical protein